MVSLFLSLFLSSVKFSPTNFVPVWIRFGDHQNWISLECVIYFLYACSFVLHLHFNCREICWHKCSSLQTFRLTLTWSTIFSRLTERNPYNDKNNSHSHCEYICIFYEKSNTKFVLFYPQTAFNAAVIIIKFHTKIICSFWHLSIVVVAQSWLYSTRWQFLLPLSLSSPLTLNMHNLLFFSSHSALNNRNMISNALVYVCRNVGVESSFDKELDEHKKKWTLRPA